MRKCQKYAKSKSGRGQILLHSTVYLLPKLELGEASWKMASLSYLCHQKHQQELSQLQDLLRERSKENKRLKSSFDTIKELNDNMRKQVTHADIKTMIIYILLNLMYILPYENCNFWEFFFFCWNLIVMIKSYVLNLYYYKADKNQPFREIKRQKNTSVLKVISKMKTTTTYVVIHLLCRKISSVELEYS